MMNRSIKVNSKQVPRRYVDITIWQLLSSNMALLTLLAKIRKQMWPVMATPTQPVDVYT
jgi:hypothetical protein